MLKPEAVIEYLNELYEKYVLVPIDKAANNIVIICKKYYVFPDIDSWVQSWVSWVEPGSPRKPSF